MKKFFVHLIVLFLPPVAFAFQVYLPLRGADVISSAYIFHFSDGGYQDEKVVYGFTLAATGGNPLSGYTWTLSNGSFLPPGVCFKPLTGVIEASGGSLVPGTYHFSMTVNDGSSTAQSQVTFYETELTLRRAEYETFLDTTPFDIFLWPSTHAYSDTYYASSVGVTLGAYAKPPLRWSITSGALPEGLVLDAAKGVIRGLPFESSVGQMYTYTISVTDASGLLSVSHQTHITVNQHFSSIETPDRFPAEYSFEQNYPNPFNPSTTIRFNLPKRSLASLRILDALGREAANLVSEELPAGTHSMVWNASGFPSGVYFCQLRAGSFMETRKLVLLR